MTPFGSRSPQSKVMSVLLKSPLYYVVTQKKGFPPLKKRREREGEREKKKEKRREKKKEKRKEKRKEKEKISLKK